MIIINNNCEVNNLLLNNIHDEIMINIEPDNINYCKFSKNLIANDIQLLNRVIYLFQGIHIHFEKALLDKHLIISS